MDLPGLEGFGRDRRRQKQGGISISAQSQAPSRARTANTNANTQSVSAVSSKTPDDLLPTWFLDSADPEIPKHNSKLGRLPTEAPDEFAYRIWWDTQCKGFNLAAQQQEARERGGGSSVQGQLPARRVRTAPSLVDAAVPISKITSVPPPPELGAEVPQDGASLLRCSLRLWHEFDDPKGALQLMEDMLEMQLSQELRTQVQEQMEAVLNANQEQMSQAHSPSDEEHVERLRVAPQGVKSDHKWFTIWSSEFKADGITIQEGSLAMVMQDDQVGFVRGEEAIPLFGSTYFEVTIEASQRRPGDGLGNGYLVGLCGDQNCSSNLLHEYRRRHNLWVLQDMNNDKYGMIFTRGNSRPWVFGSGFGNGDTIGVDVNMDTRSVVLWKNGVRLGGEICFDLPEVVYPFCTLLNSGVSAKLSFPGVTPEYLYSSHASQIHRKAKIETRTAMALKDVVVSTNDRQNKERIVMTPGLLNNVFGCSSHQAALKGDMPELHGQSEPVSAAIKLSRHPHYQSATFVRALATASEPSWLTTMARHNMQQVGGADKIRRPEASIMHHADNSRQFIRPSQPESHPWR